MLINPRKIGLIELKSQFAPDKIDRYIGTEFIPKKLRQMASDITFEKTSTVGSKSSFPIIFSSPFSAQFA